jgi:hypothetical protein
LNVLKRLTLFLFLLPFAAMGQYRITGRVVDAATKQPVADASVFLSNASAGAKTNNDGTFTMNNVRGGQYVMVISIIGYATYQQSILVNKDLVLGDLTVQAQSIVLKEVRIGPDKHWAEHFEIFKREFLGTTDNANECTILNPHVVEFDFDSETHELTATADGFLEVENKAMGYKIKYMLSAFTYNNAEHSIYFAGSAFFEDLKGSKKQIKEWQKTRLQTYLGSDMNFLRAGIANKVPEQGFMVERLIRTPNPEYKGGPDNKYRETLVNAPLAVSDYMRLTDVKDEYAIDFKDCLYVVYNHTALSGSTITIQKNYAYFDNNGIFLNPQDMILEGSWGVSRLADMLPVDYEPTEN